MTTPIIPRLRAASGPDRNLDAEIALLVGARTAEDLAEWRDAEHLYSFPECRRELPEEPEFYTASIDAALMLLPDGWTGIIPCRGGRDEEAWLWPENHTMTRGHRVNAATPAIALTIACLKARGIE